MTLIGPAGTGKTRLVVEAAAQVAHEFRDGAWFVGLASVADPRQVPAAVAAGVRVREVGGKPASAVLVDHFRTRHCLLILDNFEHVLDAAPLLTDLLAGAPSLSIAATEPSRASAVRRAPLSSASPRPDGRPRVGRGQTVRRPGDERLAGLRRDVRECPDHRRHLRAARRSAAGDRARRRARARAGIDEVARRLDHRLSLLSTGPRDAPDRHRTLRAALAWSHELLRPEEAVLFRRLGVFSGGAGPGAIERVCVADAMGDLSARVGDVFGVLDELVGHSLVQADSAAGTIRYRLLETVREFAIERLEDSGESPAIHRRHAEWCAELLESIAGPARLRPGEVRAAEPEIGNILSALDWAEEAGEVDLGLRICGSAWRLWERGQHLREGLAWTQRFLALEPPEPNAEHRIRALEALGAVAYWLGDGPAAVAAYQERLGLAERLGHATEVADGHLDLYFGLAIIGEMSAARDRAGCGSCRATKPLGIGSGPLAAGGPSPRCC